MGSPRLRGAGVSTSNLDVAEDEGAAAIEWKRKESFHDFLNHSSAWHAQTSCSSSQISPQAVHCGESIRPAACNLAAGQRPPHTKLRRQAASKTGNERNTDNIGVKKGSVGKLGLPTPASRHNANSASLLASHRTSVGHARVRFINGLGGFGKPLDRPGGPTRVCERTKKTGRRDPEF